MGDWMDRPTRPASSVFHDRLKRSSAVREITTRELPNAVASCGASSPRVKPKLSQASTVSTCSSHRSVGYSSPQGAGFDPTQLSTLGMSLPPSTVIPHPSDDGSDPPVSQSHATSPDGGENRCSIAGFVKLFGYSPRDFRILRRPSRVFTKRT